jgi:hypothetical protein
VGLCFVVPMAGNPAAVEGGEALEFAWIPTAGLDDLADQCWPGTVDAVRATIGRRAEAEASPALPRALHMRSCPSDR